MNTIMAIEWYDEYGEEHSHTWNGPLLPVGAEVMFTYIGETVGLIVRNIVCSARHDSVLSLEESDSYVVYMQCDVS